MAFFMSWMETNWGQFYWEYQRLQQVFSFQSDLFLKGPDAQDSKQEVPYTGTFVKWPENPPSVSV